MFCRETEHSFSRNFEIFALAFACTSISCCSIFNDQFPLHSLSCAQPWYYTTTTRLCQGVLKKFFKNFFRGIRLSSRPLVDSLHIIALSFWFVKRFLTKKSDLEDCLIWTISAVAGCAHCTVLKDAPFLFIQNLVSRKASCEPQTLTPRHISKKPKPALYNSPKICYTI